MHRAMVQCSHCSLSSQKLPVGLKVAAVIFVSLLCAWVGVRASVSFPTRRNCFLIISCLGYIFLFFSLEHSNTLLCLMFLGGKSTPPREVVCKSHFRNVYVCNITAAVLLVKKKSTVEEKYWVLVNNRSPTVDSEQLVNFYSRVKKGCCV